MLSKPWIVQKYGGTSIGNLLPEITGFIVPPYLQTHQIAVVCSARSGTTKSSGTTSLLLETIRLATTSEPCHEDIIAIIEKIRGEHLLAAESALGPDAREHLRAVRLEIMKDCTKLRKLLEATAMLTEISGHTMDRVLATGESLSCRIVAASLQSKGIPSKVVILDDIVGRTYGEDHDELEKCFRRSPGAFLRGLCVVIRREIESCGTDLPVLSGFFGAMPGSLIKSVSRGYSDLCAALCAVAIGAEELQIWKEVDGIFTADPRKIQSARLLATVTTEEAAELTYYGSEVIHFLTIEQIDAAGISLRLKNVMNPEGAGTIIHPSQKADSAQILPGTPNLELVTESNTYVASSKIAFMTANGYYGASHYRRKPTAVTVKENIIILNIQSHGTCSPQAFLSRVSACLENNNLTIDLISSSRHMLSLAMCASEPRNIEHASHKLEAFGRVSLIHNMSIVSVIGHRMRNVVGIGAEIFAALASSKVNIYLISQGASEINISFVIDARNALTALEVVHEKVLGVPRHEETENSFVKGPWLY